MFLVSLMEFKLNLTKSLYFQVHIFFPFLNVNLFAIKIAAIH